MSITETPPLPGIKLVQDVNKALATDFAGPDDPAALAGAWMSWADTGNMLLKRRNAANSAWVTEGYCGMNAPNAGDSIRHGVRADLLFSCPAAIRDFDPVISSEISVAWNIEVTDEVVGLAKQIIHGEAAHLGKHLVAVRNAALGVGDTT